MDWGWLLNVVARNAREHGWRIQDIEQLEAEARSLQRRAAQRTRRATWARAATWTFLLGGAILALAMGGTGLPLVLVAPFTHVYRRIQERTARTELATARVRAGEAGRRRRKLLEREAAERLPREGTHDGRRPFQAGHLLPRLPWLGRVGRRGSARRS